MFSSVCATDGGRVDPVGVGDSERVCQALGKLSQGIFHALSQVGGSSGIHCGVSAIGASVSHCGC